MENERDICWEAICELDEAAVALETVTDVFTLMFEGFDGEGYRNSDSVYLDNFARRFHIYESTLSLLYEKLSDLRSHLSKRGEELMKRHREAAAEFKAAS